MLSLRAVALGLATAVLVGGCKPHPQVKVHVWTASEIRDELYVHLQRIGTLSGYIMEVTPSREVLVLTPTPPGVENHACTTPQKPTALKQAVELDALHRTATGFEAVSRNLLEKKPTQFKPFTHRHECDARDQPDWKPMTIDEVQQQTSLELQRIGELSRYIRSVEPGGTIQVWSYDETDAGCAARLSAYPADTPVDKDALSLVEHALEAANAALAAGQEASVHSTPRPCAP
jgi:hypothetical protein